MKKVAKKHCKALPIHIACATGNKGALKSIVSTLPKRGLEIKDSLGRTPLILTVSKNHISCCSILLKAGATVDNTDYAGQTALHIAANKGLHHFVKLLLHYKASWIQRDYSGATAIHMAAVNPNPKGLLLIMKHVKPAEIDIQDSTLKTPLHWGAAYTCNESIKVLLAQGANPCIPDQLGKTPLHWAAANSNTEALRCVKTLLKKENCLINWQDYDGISPLHIAVTNGTEDVVYFLASVENCNVDIIDNSFLTPLHYAAKRGLAEKADILLKKRANHLSIDDYGAMPLHYAVYMNDAETVKVFTNKSYVSDHPDKYGRSALTWAAIKNSTVALKILAASQAVSLEPDRNGCTALHAAAMYGSAACVELLINAGLYVDSKDKYGMTPFLKACEYGRTKAAEALLNLGANIEEKDIHSSSALHWCAKGGHAYLTHTLIEHGADFNLKDNLRMTPLHHVSSNGDFVNCTCVLVESGAYLDVVDIEGKTPLHAAVLNERYGIVKYLCEYQLDVNAMFLMYKNWVTPYDCAMFRCNVKIAVVLEKCGGIRLQNIEEYAAKLIQSWYKMKRLMSKTFAIKRSKALCSWYLKKNFGTTSVCQMCSLTDKKRDLFFICDNCFNKYAQHQSIKKDNLMSGTKIPDSCRFSNISLTGSILGFKLLTICNNPCTCSGLFLLDNLLYKNSSFHVLLGEAPTIACLYDARRNTAARVIQKAWDRYKLKKKFLNVRNEVGLCYINHIERTTAEVIWHMKFQSFLHNSYE